MTPTTALIMGLLAGGAAAALMVVLWFRRKETAEEGGARSEAEQIRARAREEARRVEDDARAAAEQSRNQALAELEKETGEKRKELERLETRLLKREKNLDRRNDFVNRKDRDNAEKQQQLDERMTTLANQEDRVGRELASIRRELEKVASMTADEARRALEEKLVDEARREAAGAIREVELEARGEADKKARQVIAAAIQRYASEYVAERTVSVVHLPSDDLKGRIIGREGRNIRALEAATGCDLIIDDTPEAVVLSGFNPVRREIARRALVKLIQDGRIHPTRIEEVVARSAAEMDAVLDEAGQQAALELGLAKVHPELVRMLGRLKFQQTYAQNLLLHSIEVGFIAGLIAGEIGANVKLARRAGLLHDIGKAADQEQDGSHAQIGAQLARRYGEKPVICQAIANHHEEHDKLETLLDNIVAAANLLSTERPGARRDQLDLYVKRLEQLEAIPQSFDGVEKAFAVQSGREVRVMVVNERISDEGARILARDIAQRIEEELATAGQVKVSVIRETRSIEYAR